MGEVVPLRPARAQATDRAVLQDEPVHRVVVDGALEHRPVADDPDGAGERLLAGSVELHPGQGDATLLDVREPVDGTPVIEVLVLGSVQSDRALTVTVVLAAAASADAEDDRPAAFSTVVAPDGVAPFDVTRVSDAGGLAVASGTIRNTLVPAPTAQVLDVGPAAHGRR